MSIVNLVDVRKVFSDGECYIDVLKNVNLSIDKGELLAIVGPSGSGKSTLMNVLGFMDKPTSGKYLLEDKDTAKFNDFQYAKLRSEKVSFIFQEYNLLEDYTVYDNIELPLLHRRMRKKEKKELIFNTLKKLGIEHKIDVKASKLSGGEKQRVAIARALVTGCDILLADEPTGALDQGRGKDIMDLLQVLNKEGKTIIVVTHDPNIAARCKRMIRIVDGVIYEENEQNQTIV